jgi:hypothetical protein
LERSLALIEHMANAANAMVGAVSGGYRDNSVVIDIHARITL